MTRIGLITQWYDPESGSAQTPGVIARHMRKRGHSVSVLTGFPNYPAGKLYPGYRLRWYSREDRDGVAVHRAPLWPDHAPSAGRRALNYLSFAVGATIVGMRVLRDVQVNLVYSSPITAAVPALVLRAIARIPFVLQVQDMWPQTVMESGFLAGRGAVVERGLQRFCDYVYRRARSIAVTSPGMKDLITSRGIPPEKVLVVPNWSDERSFYPVEPDAALKDHLGLERPFTVMYAGNVGDLQALDALIDAAAVLKERTDIGFAIVGDGVQRAKLEHEVSERALKNVSFHEPQPFSRMAAVLALGDVQFVSLKDMPLFRTTVPSKLQATLAAGRPILGALRGDAEEIITAAQAGVVVEPESVQGIVNAILSLRDLPAEELAAMGRRGAAYYRSTFSESASGSRLSRLLEDAVVQKDLQ
ncbi:glycosyltransferase family 4 protein [Georgenia sp. 10Sc9-8]|uniref:D-inositol 3-phosphate glycosyltransferase n=1 Tax=Georgenia halotolerans TaxID=3028317 RepID=A0ABT5TZJ6_9MICO|nr:glycosyltransferase family 4 protein [Georgenia halotolerans]